MQKFCEFENSSIFRKISKLQQPDISETRKNEKFRKFCLTQGLIEMIPSNISHFSGLFDLRPNKESL